MQLCDVSDADVKFPGIPGFCQSSMVEKLKYEAICQIHREIIANLR